jgi:iron complex outermembrane receptor protein
MAEIRRGVRIGRIATAYSLLRISASVLAVGIGASAHAAVEAAPAANITPEAEAGSGGGVGEIMVTARRRKEDLELTPVSATVLSGANLDQQNIRNFQDLRGAVSNLEVLPQASGGSSFTIRGIGQTQNQVNNESKAGFYVDEMYVSRQEGNDLYFYDIDSLQVLKGPQGTLFGKNTTAGAVLLTTQRPTNEFGGFLQVRGGSYKRIETEGAINVPLTEDISSRLSFRTQNADGYITHLLDDGRSGNIDNKSVRLQLRDHSGPLTVDLLGEYNESNTDGGADIPVKCETDAFYIYNYNALHSVGYCDAYPVLNKKYKVYGGATLSAPTSTIVTDQAVGGDANGTGVARYVGQGPFNRTHVYTLNGRLNYELTDKIAIHSVTAYRRSRAAFYTAVNDAPNDIYAEYDNTNTKQFTQELTLGGSALNDRLNFVTGLYYFNQKTGFLQDTGPDWVDPLGYVYDASLKYQSYAAFAQASFKFTPKLELTLGARYSHDHKSGSSYVFFTDNDAAYIDSKGVARTCSYNQADYGPDSFAGDFIGGLSRCAGPAFTAVGKRSWHGFDPKAQLGYQWTDNLYTYVTASHGYNAGGFNMQLGSQPANGQFPSSYDPEKLWSYEGGVKAQLFNHKLVLNLSGFYQKYSAIQSTVLVLIGGISTRQLQSAASAHEAGMEGEFTFQPTPDLEIRGNVSYLTQAYDKIYPGATINIDTPVNSAPKYTYSAAVSYTVHTGQSGRLVPSVDVRGVGKKLACQTGTTFECKLPAYALVGVRLDYTPSEDSRWKVGFYGTNVLNTYAQLGHSNGEYSQFGIDSITPGRPQEFGVEANVKF